MTADRGASGRGFLFPHPPRDFPGRRGVRLVLRGIHACAAALLVGAVAFEAPAAQLDTWLVATGATGGALLLTDLHASCAMLLEVHGVIVGVKIAVLALLPALESGRLVLLAATVLVATISSHMPGRYRHRLLALSDELRPDERRG